jgi:DNA-binding Lrp family transcriptional regulator
MKMKDTELKLVSELMKNSRRSDRELAKVMGISQPTITRARTKLEKEGYIKEYTLIPDFKKLGYQIMAIIFLKLSHPLSQKEREDMFRESLHLRESDLHSSFLVMDGIGMNEDIVILSFFRNFSDYASYIQSTRTEMTGKLKPFLHPEGITSFLVNLDGDVHYQPMTFSRMATHLQKTMVQDQSSTTR